MRWGSLGGAMLLCFCGSGCALVLGLDDYKVAPAGTGSSAAVTSSGQGGASAASSSSSSTAESASSSGTGGEGGAGGAAPVTCTDPSTCPGQDLPCVWRTCEAGVCGKAFAPLGTDSQEQHPNDCIYRQCNGAGVVEEVAAVVPHYDGPNDGNPCTYDWCDGMTPHNDPINDKSPCDAMGGTCQTGVCTPAQSP